MEYGQLLTFYWCFSCVVLFNWRFSWVEWLLRVCLQLAKWPSYDLQSFVLFCDKSGMRRLERKTTNQCQWRHSIKMWFYLVFPVVWDCLASQWQQSIQHNWLSNQKIQYERLQHKWEASKRPYIAHGLHLICWKTVSYRDWYFRLKYVSFY